MKLHLFFITLLSLPFQVSAQDSTIKFAPREYPVLWHQAAAEYRALCYQAFNMAQLRLDALPKRKFRKGRLAIITDLDETILDNSYSEANNIKLGREFNTASWKDWINQSKATGVPGAVAFLQAAAARGVTIFYISNRDSSDIRGTLANLKKLQLPNADTAHMLFAQDGASKEPRRLTVMNQYEVVLLLGDNLSDFSDVFEHGSIASRFAGADQLQTEWGRKFIVLPNSIYGEWENAMYNYQHGLSPQQKATMRRQVLTGY